VGVKRRDLVYEIWWGEMVLNDDKWEPSAEIKLKLKEGWEPYAVCVMFSPNDEGGYKFTERHWLRRRTVDA
jgi:hypothetical protein